MNKRMRLLLTRVFIVSLVLTGTGCMHASITTTATPVIPGLTSTNTPTIKSQVIQTGQQVSDFGWLPNGQIYYGIQQGDLSNWPYMSFEENLMSWFAYDLVKETTNEIQSPYPSVDTETLRMISKDGNLKLVSIEPAPSSNVLLYASISGSGDTPVHDQVPLIKLYAARQQGKKNVLLSDDFYHVCGIPNSRSQWSEDETWVAGSCEVLQGMPGYFIVDLVNDKVQWLFYETANGDPIYPTSIALAHRTPLLAIESGFLWITPISISKDQSPIQLGQSSLAVQGSVSSPLWSDDDQWLYYWQWGPVASSYDEITGRKLYPWRLERMNITTRHSEVILSEKDLRAVLGDTLYELNMDYGARVSWRLSPAGHQALLFMYKTNASPHELFLISW